MANKNLQAAKTAKKDEFYTQLTDIEKELRHYKEHFRDKVVLCNCDDPRVSNFFRYFALNFEHLGLKRLICTCYQHQDIDLFGDHGDGPAVYIIYEGSDAPMPDFDNIQVKPLKGDGDFRSQECIELLKQADIVVTNPPFSLFREYVAQLMEYEKKFLIIGNVNAISYKDFFPYIQKELVWIGPSIHSGDREFQVPDEYPLTASSARIDERGNKFIRVKGVRWWTNLEFQERHEPMILYKRYTADEYPKYSNYDAINITKVSEIPHDYFGLMGVPLTYMDKHCPEQFEIVGLMASHGKEPRGIENESAFLNGKWLFPHLLIRRKQ